MADKSACRMNPAPQLIQGVSPFSTRLRHVCMRWQIPLAVMTAGLTPATCQISFSDYSLSQQWVQVLPAPTRGTGGTATVTKKPLNAPINYYQIDLLVNANGSLTASAAAVMINTEASYAPASLGPLGSFLYSESSNHFSGSGQLCG